MHHPLLSTLQGLLQAPAGSGEVFALVDPAAVPDARRWLTGRFGTECTMLRYPGLVSGDAESVIPFLAKAPLEPGQCARMLVETLCWAETEQAVVWVRSRLDEPTLAQALGLRMDVALPGDKNAILRYWDARCVRPLYDLFDDAQRSAFFGVAQGWWYLDRSEELQALPLPSDAAATPFFPPLRLSRAQEDQMMEGTEADAVMRLLREDAGDELAAIERKHRYAFVSGQVARAQAWGLQSVSELALFCMVALSEGEAFSTCEVWQALLKRVQSREIGMVQAVAEFARQSDGGQAVDEEHPTRA